MSASSSESLEARLGRPLMWHERVALHKQDHPEQTDYWIHTESTASALLLSMAAAMKLMSQQPGLDPQDRRDIKQTAARYRHSIVKGTALDTLRELLEAGPLVYCDMNIRVPTPEECARLPAGMPYFPPEGR